MKIYKYPSKQDWENILKRPQLPGEDLDLLVKNILNDVKNRGDEALKEYSEKFDKVKIDALEVSKYEMDEASSRLDMKLKDAIKLAIENIKKFHESQVVKEIVVETMPGVKCWQKPSPIEKVGLYIPGGSAPLFSTVLMLAVPAVIAGCREIILCSPPSKDGSLHPAILYAANLTGVTKVYKLGGVQAIAAMAYGSESVPRVYKIFGPGNQYVTAAKQLVNREGIAIDMPAGPSEVLVVADETSNPAFVASDLLAQAEHGADSHVVLVSLDENIINLVLSEMKLQLEKLPRKDMAKQSTDKSVAILVKSEDELVDIINVYGPEHLILSNKDYKKLSENVINAGSVFLGKYTPESAGDYASGTNHTLPTYGFAKAFNGVNIDSFVKKITYQEISRDGLRLIGPAIETMAETESLFAHKNAVTLRLNENENI